MEVLVVVLVLVAATLAAVLGFSLAMWADARGADAPIRFHALGAEQGTSSPTTPAPTLRQVHQARLRQWQEEYDLLAYPGVRCICGLEYTSERGVTISVPRLCAVRGHSRKGDLRWASRVEATWEALNYAGPNKPEGRRQQARTVARFEVTPSAFIKEGTQE